MENNTLLFLERLKSNKDLFHNVISFQPGKDKIKAFDCSANNIQLSEIDFTDTDAFSNYMDKVRLSQNARYLIGGYNEDRALYKRSILFDGPLNKELHKYNKEENRTIHLGIDIWGEAGSEIYAPVGGRVHSFAFNNHFGDYGATLILLHQLNGLLFHTLYGHLSLKDIGGLNEGKFLNRGALIGHFGTAAENGHWPPHLHFQVVLDMKNHKGDYPGVCSNIEKIEYLQNSPDPDVILNLNKYL